MSSRVSLKSGWPDRLSESGFREKQVTDERSRHRRVSRGLDLSNDLVGIMYALACPTCIPRMQYHANTNAND